MFDTRKTSGCVIGEVGVKDVAPVGDVVSRFSSSHTEPAQAERVAEVVTMLCQVVPSVV